MCTVIVPFFFLFENGDQFGPKKQKQRKVAYMCHLYEKKIKTSFGLCNFEIWKSYPREGLVIILDCFGGCGWGRDHAFCC